MGSQGWVLALPWLVAVAMTIWPTVLDIKYREVPEHFWVTGSKLGLAVSLVTYLGLYPPRLLAAYYGLSLLGAGVVGLASLLGLMGPGDFWAALALSLTLPAPLPGSLVIPPIYIVLFVASLAELASRAIISYRVCGSLSCLDGAVVPCSMLLRELKWWFPVTSRAVSDVPSEAVIRACPNANGQVKARPGLPYVAFILLALPASLAVEALVRVP